MLMYLIDRRLAIDPDLLNKTVGEIRYWWRKKPAENQGTLTAGGVVQNEVQHKEL